MKRIFLLFPILICSSNLVRADDQTRNVQTELKNQGFYYGDVDGKQSTELSAAIRRYQIRNGLEVSGVLNAQTLGTLGLGPAPAPNAAPAHPGGTATTRPQAPTQARPAAPAAPAPAESAARPPVNLKRDDPDASAPQRRYVAPDEAGPPARTSRYPSVVPPPAPLDDRDPTVSVSPSKPGGNPYAQTFAGTPYSTAPRVVQESTVRRAQQILADRGFFHQDIDGQAGPFTEEALLSYQRDSRLPMTGRLDLQTLATLRLLPGRGAGNPPLKPFSEVRPVPSSRPVYRGVWVD